MHTLYIGNFKDFGHKTCCFHFWVLEDCLKTVVSKTPHINFYIKLTVLIKLWHNVAFKHKQIWTLTITDDLGKQFNHQQEKVLSATWCKGDNSNMTDSLWKTSNIVLTWTTVAHHLDQNPLGQFLMLEMFLVCLLKVCGFLQAL